MGGLGEMIVFAGIMWFSWWLIGLFPWIILSIAFIIFCLGVKLAIDGEEPKASYIAPPSIVLGFIVMIITGVHLIWF